MSFQTYMFFREIQKEMLVRMFQLLFIIKWKQMVIYTSKLTLCHRQNFFFSFDVSDAKHHWFM